MANNHDARPFVDLQKDADEFEAKFVEDIEKCKSILDAKITALICDPDSLGNSVGPRQNASVEFSKAKYEIYISMKSLMNDMEREWQKYISEMKKLFIDNVEVFLANTKLEVKLPPSEYRRSLGPKKSSAANSSIYPLLSCISQSISGFSQKNKAVDDEMEMNEAEIDLNTSWSSSRCRKSVKLDIPQMDLNKSLSSSWLSNLNERLNLGCSYVFAENGISDDEDIDEEKSYFSEPSSTQRGRKGQFTTENKKIKGISSKKVSSSESQEETNEIESGLTLVNSRKSINRSSSRSKSTAMSKESRTNTSDENEEVKEIETNNYIVSVKGRKKKQPPKSQAKTKKQEKNTEEPECEEEPNVTSVISETRRGRSAVAGDSANVSGKTTRQPGRPARRKTMNKTVIERETSKLTEEHDINDDFDIETPVARPSKFVARRKTLLPNLEEHISGLDMIPRNTSARSKRKTISGVSDLASVAPSKRLKNSNTSKRNYIAETEDAVTDNKFLEISDSYSQWIAVNSIDGKIPAGPGIYEVKVWRAKKSAYIGCCDSLRQKLILHKLKQNSGHKHLDKFIDRNYDDIQIRYEVVPSVNDAKVEVKNRVNSFVALHKTTPAYN